MKINKLNEFYKEPMTDETFYSKYHPEFNRIYQAQDTEKAPEDRCPFAGCMYETYGAEYEVIKAMIEENPKRIWTIQDADNDTIWIVAGFQYINRLGYLITTEEWDNIFEEYLCN